MAMFAGCAGKTAAPPYKKLPQKVPTEEKGEEAAPPVSVVPSGGVSGPERRASMQLVEKGRVLMDGDDAEAASTAFRDAMNVDSTNGEAYYYLALAYYYTEKPDLASGLLDKAEQLLGSDEAWRSKIDELRGELGAGKAQIEEGPKDEGF